MEKEFSAVIERGFGAAEESRVGVILKAAEPHYSHLSQQNSHSKNFHCLSGSAVAYTLHKRTAFYKLDISNTLSLHLLLHFAVGKGNVEVHDKICRGSGRNTCSQRMNEFNDDSWMSDVLIT